MTAAARRVAILTNVVLAGCTSRALSTKDAGSEADRWLAEMADSSDLAEAGEPMDAPADEVTETPADASNAPLCPGEDVVSLVPSAPACDVVAVDPSALCAGGTPCPVTAMFSLSCHAFGYGPWVAPTGNGGSVMFVTAENSFVTRLFTLEPGSPPRVEDVLGVTSASNTLTADDDGNPMIFAGEMPGGIWRLRKTALGWRRERTFEGSATSMVADGRARDAMNASVAYVDFTENVPRLATRKSDCWHTSVLPGRILASMALDLDAANQPWVAWFYSTDTGKPTIELAGPEGAQRVWTSSVGEVLRARDRPFVLGGGFSGGGTWPTLGTQRIDGAHVLVPDSTLPSWTDEIIPGSALAARAQDCPASDCGGLVTCTTKIHGPVPGFALVRMKGGRAYAAWLESDGETTYALSSADAGLSEGGVVGFSEGGVDADGSHVCSRTETSSQGSATIVLERVDKIPPREVSRLRIDVGHELLEGALALAARGDTLLIVASVGASDDARLRYIELDTTQLP